MNAKEFSKLAQRANDPSTPKDERRVLVNEIRQAERAAAKEGNAYVAKAVNVHEYDMKNVARSKRDLQAQYAERFNSEKKIPGTNYTPREAVLARLAGKKLDLPR